MRIILFRVIAAYAIVMGVATGIHVILSPAIYANVDSTPVAWLVMNPMNCAAAILILIVTVARKVAYDRARHEGNGSESVIEHLDTNIPMYVAAVLSILYPINTLHEIWSPNIVILPTWYYLDAGIASMGIAIGIRILRASGLRIIY